MGIFSCWAVFLLSLNLMSFMDKEIMKCCHTSSQNLHTNLKMKTMINYSVSLCVNLYFNTVLTSKGSRATCLGWFGPPYYKFRLYSDTELKQYFVRNRFLKTQYITVKEAPNYKQTSRRWQNLISNDQNSKRASLLLNIPPYTTLFKYFFSNLD